jgi:hypothetical protein
MKPPDGAPSAIDAYRHRLDHLAADGRQLRAGLADAPDDIDHLSALRAWQTECAATVSQLSGGSKMHWLSRAFSDALLVRATTGGSASVVAIIDRLLGVLDSAGQTLAGASPSSEGGAATPPPLVRPRFAFIENATLRSGLEQAYRNSQDWLSNGESSLSMMTTCAILETVITDALERRGREALAQYSPPPGPIVTWPFSSRISVAEQAGVISQGCARLPAVAREYRTAVGAGSDSMAGPAVSARDAKLTRDVLHVILRDLAPGR